MQSTDRGTGRRGVPPRVRAGAGGLSYQAVDCRAGVRGRRGACEEPWVPLHDREPLQRAMPSGFLGVNGAQEVMWVQMEAC